MKKITKTMNLNICRGVCPYDCAYHRASDKLKAFADQLNQASDPFELCLQTLPRYLVSPQSQNAKKREPNWATFHFPEFDSYGYHVLNVFAEWFVSLNDEKRTKVFHNFIEKPIVVLSLCRLISLLHLQHQFSPHLCFIPVVINGASNSDLLCINEYMAGYDQSHSLIGQLRDELRELESDEMQLAELAKKNNVGLDVCRKRVQQCLDRCCKILLESRPKQLSSENTLYFSHLIDVKDGRRPVTQLLCHTFFPNAYDPFALLLEVFNIVCETETHWAQFRFLKKKGTYGMVVIDAFAQWFQSLDDAKKKHVFSSFVKNPLQAACSEGNFESMCRLATRLHLQQYILEPETFLIPTHLKDPGSLRFVFEYLDGCDRTLVEQFATRLDALLLPSNQNKLAEFSGQCNVNPPLTQSSLGKTVSKCKKKYHLSDSVVPNTALHLPETVNPIHGQLLPIWLGEDGRAKLIESLSQTHFPKASDPFALLLRLIAPAVQSWSNFRFARRPSAFRDTVIEAFKVWLHSLDIDKKNNVFTQFMKQPIEDACQNDSSSTMCRLASRLRLQQFNFDPELFLFPTYFKDQGCDFVIEYLNGCERTLVEQFATRLDVLLHPSSEKELGEFSKRCKVAPPLTLHTLAKAISKYKKKYRLDDTAVPNTLAVLDLPVPESPIHGKLFPIWLGENGRAKLIESLSQTHFPKASDPFALLLHLIAPADQSWGQFRFAYSPSAYCDTVVEAFKMCLHSLDIDKKNHVFSQFMKQPIEDACHTGNGPTMCHLLTKLDLFGMFENEDDLFLIPALLKNHCQFLVGYLNGCHRETRERFLSKVDSFLAMTETERTVAFEKCGIARQVQCREIANTLVSIQRKCDIPDSCVPNVTGFRAKEKCGKTMKLVSSPGPRKHLSPPQGMIELHKENTQIKSEK